MRRTDQTTMYHMHRNLASELVNIFSPVSPHPRHNKHLHPYTVTSTNTGTWHLNLSTSSTPYHHIHGITSIFTPTPSHPQTHTTMYHMHRNLASELVNIFSPVSPHPRHNKHLHPYTVTSTHTPPCTTCTGTWHLNLSTSSAPYHHIHSITSIFIPTLSHPHTHHHVPHTPELGI